MTFSIVAFDPASGDLGVATQSKFLAVGAVVPWARAEVGAIATQSFANVRYGPDGLDAPAARRPAWPATRAASSARQASATGTGMRPRIPVGSASPGPAAERVAATRPRATSSRA